MEEYSVSKTRSADKYHFTNNMLPHYPWALTQKQGCKFLFSPHYEGSQGGKPLWAFCAKIMCVVISEKKTPTQFWALCGKDRAFIVFVKREWSRMRAKGKVIGSAPLIRFAAKTKIYSIFCDSE